MRRLLVVAVTMALAVAVLAPAASAAPKEGVTNRGGVVHVSALDIPIPCGLTLDVTGWFRDMGFKGENNRNLFLTVFHLKHVYTNDVTGETWTWNDPGPDHGYFDEDGNFVATFSGRPSLSGVIGHSVVVNGNPDRYSGKLVFDVPFQPMGLDILACDELT